SAGRSGFGHRQTRPALRRELLDRCRRMPRDRTRRTDMLDRLDHISLIDDDQIGLLRDALDPDELAAMLSELPLAARQTVEAMKAAAGSQELEGVRRAAHILKGTASSFGAARLAEIAREIELELPSIAEIDRIMPLLIETIAKT